MWAITICSLSLLLRAAFPHRGATLEVKEPLHYENFPTDMGGGWVTLRTFSNISDDSNGRLWICGKAELLVWVLRHTYPEERTGSTSPDPAFGCGNGVRWGVGLEGWGRGAV